MLLLLLTGCATQRQAQGPRDAALPRLFVANGNLGWAGITLGMSRADAERVLGRRLRVRYEPWADICGEHYSVIELHGRRIHIDWSAPTPDGVIEVIAVPYGGGERIAYDSDLSEAAVTAVPALVPDEEGGAAGCPYPSFLVLRSDRQQAVNLKSSGEGVFFVTHAGCVD